MRNLIFGLIMLIGLTIGIAPFMDGYLFKKFYYKQISIMQQEAQKRNPNDKVTIEIESYDLGWFKSNASLKITSTVHDNTHTTPPIYLTFHIKSIIHHGPLTHFNKKRQLGYASMESFIYLPDFLTMIIPQNKNGIMQIYTHVSLNGNTWKNYYSISAQSFEQFGNWDGLSGSMIVYLKDDKITKAVHNMVIGKVSFSSSKLDISQIAADPIKISSEETTEQSSPFWNGTASLSINMPLATIKWKDGRVLNINNFTSDTRFGSHNKLSLSNKSSIDSLQLPLPYPIDNFSKVFLTISMNDLNLDLENNSSIKNLQNPDDLLKIFVPTSRMAMNVGMSSKLGAVSAGLKLSLIALPKTQNDLNNDIITDLKIRIAQPLLEKLLELYITLFTNSAIHSSAGQQLSDLPKQAQAILAMMLQQKYIVTDKNDYSIALLIKGPMAILNSQTMTLNNLQMIPTTIQQNIMKVIMPPPAPAATPAPLPVTSAPNTSEYHCYWMDSSSGKNIWVLTPNNKQTCYGLDSCSGGLKQSGGGCYKWAASVDANPEPWGTP